MILRHIIYKTFLQYLYALAPKLICFVFSGPGKLRGMFQEHLFWERSWNRA